MSFPSPFFFMYSFYLSQFYVFFNIFFHFRFCIDLSFPPFFHVIFYLLRFLCCFFDNIIYFFPKLLAAGGKIWTNIIFVPNSFFPFFHFVSKNLARGLGFFFECEKKSFENRQTYFSWPECVFFFWWNLSFFFSS